MTHDGLPVVGLDGSKRTLDVQLASQKAARLQVDTTASGHEQLHRWLLKRGLSQAHVCLEATGTYSDAIALFLVEHGHQVSWLNPARVAAFRKSEGILSKTDRHDAWLLARFGEQKRPAACTPPPVAVHHLQVLLARLTDLIAEGQREANRLEKSRLDCQTRQDIQTHLASLSAALSSTQQRAQQVIEQDPSLKQHQLLVQSLPGIGLLTALRLLSVCWQAQCFDSAAQLVAYAGRCPVEKQSGSSVHGKPTMSKHGNALIRQWLSMAALSAMRCDGDIKQWVQQLRERGLRGKQVIVAVMRKLLHLVYGVLKSQLPYDPCKAFPTHYPSGQPPAA